MDTDTPKVHLISATPNPRSILSFCWSIINEPGFPINTDIIDMTELGEAITFIDPVSGAAGENIETIVREFLKSGLGGPLEMINFVFGFEGVTRAFTHQMVRTRLASYMQQSQRFTDFDGNLPVKMPDSIKSDNCDDSRAEVLWESAIGKIEFVCKELKALGIPTQDIRGLYPTNIKTNIIQCIDYNALRRMMSHRLCTQAQQGEWAPVAAQIKQIVTNYDPILGEGLVAACQLTGKCAFDTVLDRECPNREALKK